MDPTALNDMLKGLLMKDLRVQCRARGVTPAGGREALIERLRDNMLETQDFTMKAEGSLPPSRNASEDQEAPVAFTNGGEDDAARGNNYGRPEGQNVGNFMSDRPSSRVLAAPGGASQICFGDAAEEPATKKGELIKEKTVTVDATGMSLHMGESRAGPAGGNNYSRPEGQNVGNYMTGRNSSRVLAPPGGASQITFG